MAPQYKLTYFDFTGLGEPIRFLLSYGNLDFVDNRISKEDWPALKKKTPAGQMPILEVDGKELYQSVAIARYMGNVVGLAGKTPLENWEIDAILDTFTDMRLNFKKTLEKDAKQADIETIRKETVPFYLTKLEEAAKKNGGYLANGKLSWADLYVVAALDTMSKMEGKGFLEGFPSLRALCTKVLSVPQIKAWVEKRPAFKPL